MYQNESSHMVWIKKHSPYTGNVEYCRCTMKIEKEDREESKIVRVIDDSGGRTNTCVSCKMVEETNGNYLFFKA